MYPDLRLGLLLGAVFVWQVVLTYLLISDHKFLKSLFPKNGKRDIRYRFEEVTKFVDEFNGKVGQLQLGLKKLEKESLGFTQKIHLLRFNPYDDTGGDQSFCVAFLDKDGNGLVITSLHTRSGTRVYAKPVVLGRPGKYQFSNEEEETIKKALV